MLDNNDEIKLEVNEHETLSINDDIEDFINDNNDDFVKSEVKKESRQVFYKFFYINGYLIHFIEYNARQIIRLTC